MTSSGVKRAVGREERRENRSESKELVLPEIQRKTNVKGLVFRRVERGVIPNRASIGAVCE